MCWLGYALVGPKVPHPPSTPDSKMPMFGSLSVLANPQVAKADNKAKQSPNLRHVAMSSSYPPYHRSRHYSTHCSPTSTASAWPPWNLIGPVRGCISRQAPAAGAAALLPPFLTYGRRQRAPVEGRAWRPLGCRGDSRRSRQSSRAVVCGSLRIQNMGSGRFCLQRSRG